MSDQDDSNRENNLYLNARREWNERYGSYIAQRDQWRLIAIITSVTALVCATFYGYAMSQSRIQPFVIGLDRLGTPVAIGKPEATNFSDKKVIRSQLAQWIVSTRTVVTDAFAQRNFINHTFSMIEKGSSAESIVKRWMSEYVPFERAKTALVEINVQSVFADTEHTWRISWIETIRDRDGTVRSKKVWDALLTIAKHIPQTEQQVIANPLGIYLSSLNWSERLT